MHIISWNCAGKFREKHIALSEYNADIFVIQECENPEAVKTNGFEQFLDIYPYRIWQENAKHKGMGIFSKIPIVKQEWNGSHLSQFVPVTVDNSFVLLAVWACNKYIEEYAEYQEINYDKYTDSMIIIGDFNSNAVLDTKKSRHIRGSSHTAVVGKLASKGLVSAYHYMSGEEQGEESVPTFYMYKHSDKPFHIDYCFINADNIKSFSVAGGRWTEYSDHVPILLSTK